MQHFQLLMQTFILVRFEPSLQFLSKIAAQAIVSKYYSSTNWTINDAVAALAIPLSDDMM